MEIDYSDSSIIQMDNLVYVPVDGSEIENLEPPHDLGGTTDHLSATLYGLAVMLVMACKGIEPPGSLMHHLEEVFDTADRYLHEFKQPPITPAELVRLLSNKKHLIIAHPHSSSGKSSGESASAGE